MENYAYPSYPESSDPSPLSREIECVTVISATAPTSRVKLMCSYGGRIQPRHHDNQLAYVGGDTKILAVDRCVRFPFIIAKLSSLSGADDVLLKYKLPGEDLDSLISVMNDEDLEHMMGEYDRLYRMGLKPGARLRLFLFAAIGSNNSKDRGVLANPPPAATDSPDYLLGLEAPKLSPIEVPVKDLTVELAGIESAVAEAMISPTAVQRLEISEKQQQIPKVSRDGNLAMVYPPEYFAPLIQEKVPPPLHAYWQDQHRSTAPPPSPASCASFVGGDGRVYVFPTSHGVFTSNPGYLAAVPRVVPTAKYAAPMQQGKPPAAVGYVYDSTERAVYYAAGSGATYQAVSSNVAIAAETKVLKPSQVL